MLAADFLVCSFIGWVYEVLLTWAVFGYYTDRGFLPLPLCPIYGFGGMLMLAAAGKIKNPAGVFLLSALTATLLELGASYIIEAVLHMKLWDYSDWAYNFEGRIAPLSSAIFGGMGLLLIKGIHPLMKKFFLRIFNKVS
ncbi:MAG: putative ABC transporter permease [Huintestinicola sp.]